MPLPGRQLTPASGNYRYGFNGKELDNNGTGMGGGGNTYDYGFRIYNPQIAKFLSVDPLTKEYPWYTPYQFAGNMPIAAVDLDGLEEWIVVQGQLIYTGNENDPEYMFSPVVIWGDAVDGFFNVGRVLGNLIISYETEGEAIFNILISQEVWSASDLTNYELGRNFNLKKIKGSLYVVPEEGVMNNLIDLFCSVLDMSAVMIGPEKGEVFLAVKSSPLAARALSDVIEALRIHKRTDEIKKFIDPDTKQSLRHFEAEGGSIYESKTGRELRERTGDEGGDYVEVKSGRTVDHMGMPKDQMLNLNIGKFLKSIDHHFMKSDVDTLLIDLRGMSQDNVDKVFEHLNTKHAGEMKKQNRVIVITGD